ncbi:MAG: lysylphosphatidylglycerol synthase transmembrane domain-containing protein [Gammaproteobacteria bacterium]
MSNRFTQLRVIFGLALLCALVWWVDPARLVATLGRMDGGYLLICLLSLTLTVLLGAFNLNLLISRSGELPFSRFLPVYWTGWAFSLVVPGQVGDMVSLPVLLRRHGFSWQSSLGRTLVDKLLSLLVMGLFGLWGLLSFVNAHLEGTGTALWVLTVVAVLIGMPAAFAALPRQGHTRLARLRRALVETGMEARETLRANPGRVMVNFALTWLKVMVTGVAFWAMFRALGQHQVDVLQVIPLMAASSLVAYLPISFNGLGTVELAGIILFSSLGMDESTIVTAYLALRATNITLAWLPASLWLSLNATNNEQRERS